MTSRIFTGATYTCAVAATPEETLAGEQRRRIPAAAAAVAGGLLTLIAGLLQVSVGKYLQTSPDFRFVQVVDALRERLSAGPVPTLGLKAREALYLNDHAFERLIATFTLSLSAVATGIALTYLYRFAYARRPEIGRATVVVIIAGTVLWSLPPIVGEIATTIDANSFANATDQSAQAAREVVGSPVWLAGQYLAALGRLLLAVGFVLVSLKAMSVGLLTRFMGVLGVIVGVLFILPLGGSLPFVQVFWMFALGALFLHKWAGSQGLPPAWSTGEAHPWPSQQELREARLARQQERSGSRGESKPSGRGKAAGRREEAGSDEEAPASSNGKGRGRPSVPEIPAPKAPERPAHSSSKKKKRRRR